MFLKTFIVSNVNLNIFKPAHGEFSSIYICKIHYESLMFSYSLIPIFIVTHIPPKAILKRSTLSFVEAKQNTHCLSSE